MSSENSARKSSLLDLVGILSDKEAKELKRIIKENRKRRDKKANERTKRIAQLLSS